MKKVGYIELRGESRDGVIINIKNINGSDYQFGIWMKYYAIYIVSNLTINVNSSVGTHLFAFYIDYYNQCIIDNIKIILTQNHDCYCYAVYSRGYSDTHLKNMKISASNTSGYTNHIWGYHINTYSFCHLSYNLEFAGDFENVIYAGNKCLVSLYLEPNITGTATGRRFVCGAGGSIAVGGRGPNVFPGTIAGVINNDTYSWYV